MLRRSALQFCAVLLASLLVLVLGVQADTTSSISANFNGTAIAGGNTIWFNSVLKPSGLGSQPVKIFVRRSTITFTANGTNYSVAAPDANITFSPSATTATISFNAATNLWQITVPSSGLAGNTFLDAVGFVVPPAGLPGGIQNVTWQGNFSTDTAGISLQWQWGAAVYTSFSTDYNALGVKPVDDTKASQYQNSDHAGTPENFKTFVTGGATGGGGSNYTGSYSGTVSLAVPVVQPPTANAGGPYNGFVGQAISFNGTGSSDPNGYALNYSWNFGDGATGTGATPSHTYSSAGTFTVTLTVDDGRNVTGTATASATITLPPPPTITAALSPAPNASGWNNTNVTVTFTCTDSVSGVKSCSSPVTVTSEGAGQVVQGTAVNNGGVSATASVKINIDKTPPATSITSPANGATFTSSPVSVAGSVSDALSGVSTVTCNGAAASVQSGSFNCSVTLTVGPNTITAQATDVAGNAASSSVNVTFSNAPPPAITSFSPTSAPVGSLVTLTGSNFTGGGGSTPQVTLSQQGGGNIPAPISSFTATSIAFVIPAGSASGAVTVTVGSQSVTSTATLMIQPASSFTVTAAPGSANVIQGQSTAFAVSLSSSNGFTQLAALSVSGLPSGITGTFSSTQITAGQTSSLKITAPATQATGTSTLTISGSATVQGIPLTQSATVTLNVQPVSTTFLGRTVVQDPTETSLAGVTITMLGVDGNGKPTGCTGTAKSDAAGNFVIPNLPSACVGAQLIRYDGSTATSPPGVYAGVDLVYTFVAGQVTTPPFVIHLPRIDNAEIARVKQNASVDQTFTFATIPGLSVTVYAGTVFTLVDGTKPDPFPLIAIQVPVDRLPDEMPMTSSTVGAFIVAFQPANSTASQPVAVTFPNTLNTPPGVQMALDTLDPTKGVMVQYGTGTVTGSGTQILPDFDPAHPGHRFGLVHFDWHGPMPPPPPKNNPSPDPNRPKTGDPVDPATGLLVLTKTDMAFGGARGQVAIVRTYRTLSGNPGPFGIGTNHNYGYLLDTLNLVRGTGTFVNLIMPDGNQFPFAQQGTNTFVNSTIPSLLGAVITSPSSGTYNLRWKNGTVFQFSSPSAFATVAFLNSITDSNGNVVRLGRGNPSQPIQITQIIDPVGRTLNLTYDNFNRILSITDPIGKTVQYTYNSQGTLATVTDAAGGVTTYGYDAQNDLTSITDPRGITFLQNTYDANGRVAQQTAADGGVTTFAYTLLNPMVPTSPVLVTAVTDPRGNQTIYHFNPQGFLLDVTDALGEKTVYTIDSGTNQVLSVTDPLSRTTAYTYDAAGNVTGVTRLAGTLNAVSALFVYDSNLNQITSATDSLGHTTSLIYDKVSNLVSISDPLKDRTTFSYDAAGKMVTSSDPLQNVTQYSYVNGTIASVTDPLGRVTNYVSDGIGRVTSITNALGQSTRYRYNPLNQVVQILDPLGNQTSLSYDANANLRNVTDATGHTTSYTYDPMDRLTGRTDPLGNAESYQYDLDGNLTQFTDRRGVVIKYSYDALNRRIQAQFGSESSINYTYDVGNRLTRAVDSVTGTITRNYDGMDRLISETTPQGSISYSYDAVGRLVTMQVAGQPQVNYKYDDANRRTQIAQGNSTVSFSYDPLGRRTSLTLPNGVTVSYGYNAASELTSVNYQLGGSLLGNLTYTYDLAGRRTSVGGSFARTRLPTALANATYNAGNQLTQFGTSNLTYDPNGNLTSDGVNTYTWDARNRLIGITGGASGAFQYDPFGRRKRKTVNGTTTEFLYDGMNVVQELSAATPVASLLSAGLDEPLLRTDSSNTSSYLGDALGSTVALYDSNGNSVVQYTYEPFGNTAVTGSSTNPYQYTGRESDGTGLYYFRTRYYNPVLQRFISEDPLGFLAGVNKYAYVLDSPLNARDPDGTFISHHHRDITVTSAEAAGFSPEEAQALAQQVVDVDFLPGSQGADAAAANMHSMAGRKNGNGPFQKCQQAYDATANQIAQDLQAGTRDWLAKALHAIQDAYSPAHGFKPWDGGATIVAPTVVGPVVIADHVPGISHIYQDTFPGKAALDAATLASTELLDDLRDNPPGALNPRNYLPGSACGSQ